MDDIGNLQRLRDLGGGGRLEKLEGRIKQNRRVCLAKKAKDLIHFGFGRVCRGKDSEVLPPCDEFGGDTLRDAFALGTAGAYRLGMPELPYLGEGVEKLREGSVGGKA